MKSCASCIHSVKIEAAGANGVPEIGRQLYQCQFMPPTPVAIQSPQGVAIQPMFPVVTAEMRCQQWQDGDPDGAHTGPVTAPS